MIPLTSVPPRTPSAGSGALLCVRDLSVTYGGVTGIPALRHVNLEIQPGEIVGVLGESGSGKSTLALSILGLLPVNAMVQGEVAFKGENLGDADETRRRTIRGAGISMIFQDPNLALSPVMRVGDQIVEVMRAHSETKPKLLRKRCEDMLKKVHLSDIQRIYKAYPHQLSGGELHRIAIAQALCCQPDLVIADEATRSLDATLQNEVLDVLRAARERSGAAILVVTHNPALLAGFADRVVVMYAGRIVEDGPATQILSRPFHPYTKGLIELAPPALRPSPDAIRKLPVIPGYLALAGREMRGCAFEPRCPARTSVCQTEFPEEALPEAGRRVSCFNHAH